MRGFVTILKISAFVLVLGVLGALFLFLQDFQEDFGTPTGLEEESVEAIIKDNERIGFEPGQYEFNQALELIALGEIEEARQKLLLIENLYPDSTDAPEARRILGDINLDQILSVENMANKRIHRVAPGEGYLRIANENDTTLDAIMFLNGLTEFDNLHTGDELVVMPLNFKLVIDLPKKRVELYHRDYEKKEHVFARDYPILQSTWNRKGSGSSQLQIDKKWGELADASIPPTHSNYRHADKILGIEVGNSVLQLRSLPDEDEEKDGDAELPFGIFLSGPDMEELAMLMRIGNEVELRSAR